MNRLCEKLGVEYPIVQGPFGGGASSVRLLSTVSNAGGLGSFGAHYMNPNEILQLASSIRKETSRPFAINLWVSDHDEEGLAPPRAAVDRAVSRVAPFLRELDATIPEYPSQYGPRFDEQVEAILEARPPVFSFVYGVPSAAVLEKCRSRGIATIGTATTVDEAVALDQAGVDVIVASGFDAGGHRGSFLRAAEESLTGTFSLVPKVVDRVKAPVVAAGGIADARGVAAALALGASGVQVGTAFLACQESGANPVHRAVLHQPEVVDQTGLTRAFTGRLARGVRNRLMTELAPHEKDFLPYPAQGWVMGLLKEKAIAKSEPQLMSLWAGQAARLIKHDSASALMKELVSGLTTKRS